MIFNFFIEELIVSFYSFTMDLEIIMLLLCHLVGVEGFVEFAFKDKPQDAKIYIVQCHTCMHTTILSRDEIYEHLFWVCCTLLSSSSS
jgi:hypothetical protein